MAKHRHFARLMVAVALICAAGSAAFGAVSTEYLGDAVSYLGNDFKGSWVGNVGIDGYQLLNWNGNNNSSLYPSYLGTAQAGPGIAQHMWTGAAASSEARVVQGAPPNEGQRSSATWYTGSNPAYIRIPVLQDANFILGVYMFDFEGGRSGEIGVTDLSTETSPAVMINQGVYQQGKWNFFAVTATAGDTISIKLNALVSNCTASMLSFDPPAGTRVSSVSITDQSTGSTLLSNDATVDVSISAATVEPVTPAAYMITESDVEPLADDTNWVASTETTYSAPFTYTGAEGTMTLWGWVKDSEGTVKGKSDGILYYPTAPVVTSVEGPYGSTATTAVVAWSTDVPSIGRLLYRENGMSEWITTPMNSVPVTRHTRVLSGLLLSVGYEFTFENNEVQDTVRTYTHESTVPEIPKTMMSATGSSDGGNAGRMIDGDARGVFFWNPASPAYLRVNMGARYRIQMLGYKGNKGNEGIKDYEVYVTDSESSTKEDWGIPAATGQFPAEGWLRTNVDLIGSGRYLILWGTRHAVNMMSDEVWLSGANLDPVVGSFTVSDATSGSTVLTNSATVAVALAGVEGENPITGYMVTEDPVAPDGGDPGWALPAPATFDITTGEGLATLYPWVKDNAGVVIAGPPASITYSAASPVASDVGAYWVSTTTAVVGWTTDVPAVGRVLYREAGMTDWLAVTDLETTLSTSHVRTMVDLLEEFDYEFAVESNEVLSSMFTCTHTGSLAEIAKPGFGGRMVATASATQNPANPPAAAIDAIPGNALGNNWYGYYGTTSPVWLRIDLGLRYRVLQIGIQGHKENHGPDLVKVYMTDEDITAAPPVIPPEWGPVLLEDRWPVNTARQDRQMVGSGRYLIVYFTGLIYGSFIQELWLYGDNIDPVISDFSVADTTSGSTTLTDSTTVNVSMTSAEGDNPITGYMITDYDLAPEPGEQGWSETIPTTHTFVATEESDITLYAWVKDSTGVVTGSKPWTIHYQPPITVNILDVQIFGQTDTTAVLIWYTDSPCLGRAQHREVLDPPADWTIGDLDGTPVAKHTKILAGLVGGTDYEYQLENNEQLSDIYTYTHTGGVPAIPKPLEGGTMTAIADTTQQGSPAGAIDGIGSTDSGPGTWLGQYGSTAPHWLRVDLQAPYRVQRVDIQGEKYDHSLNQVSIYVTDVDSTNQADWGEPTATGSIPREATRTTFNMVGYGRYVYIYGTGHQYGTWIRELWLYGVNLNPRLDTFAASDQTTGSAVATDSATVNVAATITLGANPLTGYAITEEDLAPDPVTGTWAADMPTEYAIAGPSGDTTLYLWVKDSANTVVGLAASIYYEPAVPAVLSVQAFPHVGGSAMVVWSTSINCLGKVFYREQGTEIWLETALETQLKTIHPRVITGLAIGLTYEYYVQSNESDDAVRLYTHESELSEIPKPAEGGVMTADASNTWGDQAPDRAIDSNVADDHKWLGIYDSMNAVWLRIDLKDTYRVQRVSLRGEKYDHGLKDYQIFITDSDLTQTPDLGPMAEWGAPAATGQLPRDGWPRTDVDLIGYGRYVIIYATAWAHGSSVNEVWLYGVQEGLVAKPSVTAFGVSDLSTGSSLFTNSADVNVSIAAEAPEGRTIAGTMVTETSDAPAADDPAWADPTTAYAITGGEGNRTLFAWAKDDTGVVSDPVVATILFSTAVPTVLSKSVTDNGDGTATVAWTTDIAAEGLVQFGEVRLAGAVLADVPENALGAAHSVAISIVAGKNYKIVLVNNEVAAPAFYWPLAWPIEGDSNMDCRVNILDLIFIRNKLNQDVGTGDNWMADVNGDARINILDLIYVRNKLNTSCP